MDKNLLKDIKDLEQKIGESIKNDNIFKYRLNHTQIQILMYLLKHSDEEVCQKDLENETNLKKASITGTLDSLQEKGLVQRIQSKNDKRKNIIILSDQTIEAKDRITNNMKQIKEKICVGISKEELEVFENVISKMKNNLE